jgi:hypothetical protein
MRLRIATKAPTLVNLEQRRVVSAARDSLDWDLAFEGFRVFSGQVLRKSFSFDEETSVEHASVDVVGAGTHERTCYRQLVPSREALSAMLGEAGFVDVRSCAGWPSDDSHLLVARTPARGDR